MRVRLRQRKLRRASFGRPGQPLRYPRTNILLFQLMVIVISVFVHCNVYCASEMVIVIKIFYFQHLVLTRKIFSSFQLVLTESPRRDVVLLSELSRCVQQDCTCDEGDAMVYYIEA